MDIEIQKNTVVSNVKGFQNLRYLTISGLDNQNKGLIKNIDVLSMIHLKNLMIYRIMLEKMPEGIDTLEDLYYDVPCPLEDW